MFIADTNADARRLLQRLPLEMGLSNTWRGSQGTRLRMIPSAISMIIRPKTVLTPGSGSGVRNGIVRTMHSRSIECSPTVENR